MAQLGIGVIRDVLGVNPSDPAGAEQGEMHARLLVTGSCWQMVHNMQATRGQTPGLVHGRCTIDGQLARHRKCPALGTAATLATLPPIVFQWFFQRNLVRALTLGAVR